MKDDELKTMTNDELQKEKAEYWERRLPAEDWARSRMGSNFEPRAAFATAEGPEGTAVLEVQRDRTVLCWTFSRLENLWKVRLQLTQDELEKALEAMK